MTVSVSDDSAELLEAVCSFDPAAVLIAAVKTGNVRRVQAVLDRLASVEKTKDNAQPQADAQTTEPANTGTSEPAEPAEAAEAAEPDDPAKPANSDTEGPAEPAHTLGAAEFKATPGGEADAIAGKEAMIEALRTAAGFADTSILCMLLRRVKWGEGDQWGRGAFHVAARAGNVAALQALLNYYAANPPLALVKANALHVMGTIFKALVRCNREAALEWFLDKAHNPGGYLLKLPEELTHGFCDDTGELSMSEIWLVLDEPVLCAATEGYLGCLRLLCARSAAVCLTAALKAACAAGHTDVVNFILLGNEGHHHFRVSADGNAPFCLAAENGHLEIMEALLGYSSSVDPAACDNLPLRRAADRGHAHVVSFLLGLDHVDPGACDNEALRHAAKHGHAGVVRILCQRPDVDPGACNNQALRKAAQGGFVHVVDALLADGHVDPFDCNNDALLGAARGGHLCAVQSLARLGMDEGTREAAMDACRHGDPSGSSPSHLAVWAFLRDYPTRPPCACDSWQGVALALLLLLIVCFACGAALQVQHRACENRLARALSPVTVTPGPCEQPDADMAAQWLRELHAELGASDTTDLDDWLAEDVRFHHSVRQRLSWLAADALTASGDTVICNPTEEPALRFDASRTEALVAAALSCARGQHTLGAPGDSGQSLDIARALAALPASLCQPSWVCA